MEPSTALGPGTHRDLSWICAHEEPESLAPSNLAAHSCQHFQFRPDAGPHPRPADRVEREQSVKMSSRDKAPVFVVGSARSGNTMLYHMLLSSGHFPIYRTEPLVFDLLVPRFGDLRSAAVRRKLMRYWLRSRQFRRSGLDARQITEKVMTSVSNGGDFLRAVMEEMARAGGYQRWTVWGPDNLLYLPDIKRQIPEALFIHVVRDGRDVAVALNRKQFIRPFPWDRNYRLFVSALHWMWKVQTGRHDARTLGADYLEVHFEDLVLNPSETLERIGTFIGQTLDYDRIQKIGAVRRPNTSFTEELEARNFSPVGRWKNLLSQDQIARLEYLTGDLLVELGYPLPHPQRANLGFRLRAMRSLYPAFYDLKEWLKTTTPVGRFVNLNRLHLDESEDSGSNVGGSYEDLPRPKEGINLISH